MSAGSSAPVVQLLDAILSEAVGLKASDVHFEIFPEGFKVRARVDGVVRDLASPPEELFSPIVSRIKVLAGLDVAENRVPQDGRIRMRINGKDVDFRVSTLPTVTGESVVLRILDKGNIDIRLEELGIWEEDIHLYQSLLEFTNGMILVTGPTGSGKTTTLYAFLKELNQIHRKLITVEDPIEYDLPGVVQVPINPKIGLDFAVILRTILRQDPDVIMVGEIRDRETAEISIHSALTGHLVFSTLHTNNAPGAITRLIDMGIEPYLITATLRAAIAQRLVRRICPECIEVYEPTQAEIDAFGLTEEDLKEGRFFKGVGCEACGGSGYRGRIGIFEFLGISTELHPLILDRISTEGLFRRAKELGMVSLREDGLRKVKMGLTTLEEVLRETQL